MNRTLAPLSVTSRVVAKTPFGLSASTSTAPGRSKRAVKSALLIVSVVSSSKIWLANEPGISGASFTLVSSMVMSAEAVKPNVSATVTTTPKTGAVSKSSTVPGTTLNCPVTESIWNRLESPLVISKVTADSASVAMTVPKGDTPESSSGVVNV